jgi:hypothetical protein
MVGSQRKTPYLIGSFVNYEEKKFYEMMPMPKKVLVIDAPVN